MNFNTFFVKMTLLALLAALFAGIAYRAKGSFSVVCNEEMSSLGRDRQFASGVAFTLEGEEQSSEALRYVTCHIGDEITLDVSEARQVTHKIDREVSAFSLGDRQTLFVGRPIFRKGKVQIELVISQKQGEDPSYILVVGDDTQEGVKQFISLLRSEFDM